MADDRLERHVDSLLASYGALEGEMARMNGVIERLASVIEERNNQGAERAGRVDKAIESKADAADLADVVQELRGIKRLLTGLLVSIVLASVGFGLAALQIAGGGS